MRDLATILNDMWRRIDREPAITRNLPATAPKSEAKPRINHQARYRKLRRERLSA